MSVYDLVSAKDHSELHAVSGKQQDNKNLKEFKAFEKPPYTNAVSCDVLNSESSREDGPEDCTITIQDSNQQHRQLLYNLTETPPLHYLVLFAIQQSCLAISTPLGTAVIVAEAVCANDEDEIKVKILSSTMMMMGMSTFAMTTFGVRLPIFQGPAATYIIPLLAMMSLPEFSCPATIRIVDPATNGTALFVLVNNVTVRNSDIVQERINAYAGSLMLAGFLHCLAGLTGFVGLLARFVGPITIVPVVTLFGIYIHTVVVSFSETNWLVAVLTSVTCLVLGLYLGDYNMPMPTWSSGRGFHVTWQPYHRIFALLISILLGWMVSFVMTEYNFLPNDPADISYNARTDARSQSVRDTSWFLFPYPGQFGSMTFSFGAFITFMINTILSILDSIGDYKATARVSNAVPPPAYAVNRGIAVEGLLSIISGSMGCGHATVSYSENVGVIGISKVASRSVFQIVGVIYIAFAVFGKVGAFFMCMPYSVIGGSQIISFGILIGVILSYLQLIDLNSIRNLSIIGIALLLGMMMPHWVQKNPSAINTGYQHLDNLINLCLSNPPFVGGVFACFMDNTVPGTDRERGVNGVIGRVADEKDEKKELEKLYDHGPEVYRLPLIDDSIGRWKIARFFPIFEPQQKTHYK
ncbi:unnamed protein product [Lymnaea stagnalis]|uniref:Solute carrier family 23 member 2 n=1 Tax=Lymnaea stagnalis TaxID=6523 RepID=A0AAV2H1P5_LYMST